MANIEPSYDVAASFLAPDEPIATELAQTIAGRMSAFVYSERQKELVGRDGMSEFMRLFERDSRLVVVLYRAGWGQTPWTRVEQTAIQERGFRTGWDFLTVVNLDGSSSPDWLPKTRMWFDYGRFGMSGLAAVLEQRFQDAGGTPKVESATELAIRLRRERDAEGARVQFLATPEGVNVADAEVSTLFDEVQRVSEEVRDAISITVDRRGNEVMWLYCSGRTLSLHWHHPWSNNLNDSQLVVVQHRGRVGPGRYANMTAPVVESEESFDFNVDSARSPLWETRGEGPGRFSSRSLADEIVQQVLRNL